MFTKFIKLYFSNLELFSFNGLYKCNLLSTFYVWQLHILNCQIHLHKALVRRELCFCLWFFSITKLCHQSFLLNIQDRHQDHLFWFPESYYCYLNTSRTYSSFIRQSLWSCWFESISSTKCSGNSNWTSRIWTDSKGTSLRSNKGTFSSWRSST